jgi:hypothetical protein
MGQESDKMYVAGQYLHCRHPVVPYVTFVQFKRLTHRRKTCHEW